MNYKSIITAIAIVIFSNQILSQDNSRHSFFSFQTGVAPNYYFNNITTLGEYVDPVNFGFQGRILWNSKYRVSIGLDISPQKMYQVNDFSQDPNAYIDLWTIPIHFFIKMNVTPKLYGYGGFGPSILINNAKNSTNQVHSTTFSASDIQLGIGYKVFQYKKIHLSVEMKYFFSTKNEDMNISFPLMFSYNL